MTRRDTGEDFERILDNELLGLGRDKFNPVDKPTHDELNFQPPPESSHRSDSRTSSVQVVKDHVRGKIGIQNIIRFSPNK